MLVRLRGMEELMVYLFWRRFGVEMSRRVWWFEFVVRDLENYIVD